MKQCLNAFKAQVTCREAMVLSFPKVEETTIVNACFCNYCGLTLESPVNASCQHWVLGYTHRCFYFFPITCRGECSSALDRSPMELLELAYKSQCSICVSACSLPVDAEGQVLLLLSSRNHLVSSTVFPLLFLTPTQ